MVQAFNRRTTKTLRRIDRTPEPYGAAVSYSSRRWRAASAAWLVRYPFCVLCLAYGRINQGAQDFALSTQRNLVVDHIVPHLGDINLFWDQDNWQTLCRYPCHDKDKAICEHQHKDWWEFVRNVIAEHKTLPIIERHKQWLPEHVYIQAQPNTPNAIRLAQGGAGQSPPAVCDQAASPARRKMAEIE